jgi:hypothetical protein
LSKIFISWSGELSQKLAETIKDWLPQVINNSDPFVSSESIKKGDRWLQIIFETLEESNFGLVCLTKENLDSTWLMFESGAIAKNLSDSKVSCILFDGLNQGDVSRPLSFFQNTNFEKEDFKKLINSINDSLGDLGIQEKILNRAFEKWWPDLEEKVNEITNNYTPSPPKRNTSNLMEEIYKSTTYIQNVVSRLNLRLPKESFDLSKFDDDFELEYAGYSYNHPVKVYINPVPTEGGDLKEVIITSKGIEINDSSGPTLRGVDIDIIFHAEEDIFWKMNFHFHKGNTYMKIDFAELEVEESLLLKGETIWRD